MNTKMLTSAIAIFAALAISNAKAADLGGGLKDGPGYDTRSVEPSRSWTGFYIGLEAGGGIGLFKGDRSINRDYNFFDHELDSANEKSWENGIGGNQRTTTDDPNGHRFDAPAFLTDHQSHSFDLGYDGFFGGVNIEYLYQSGRVVFGVGGTFDYGNMKGSDSFSRNIDLRAAGFGSTGPDLGLAEETNRLSIEKKWNADLLAKVGVLATPNTLLFIEGGPSWAKFNLKGGSSLALLPGTGSDIDLPGTAFSNSDTLLGWKVGAGVSTRLGDHAIATFVADYADYGSINGLGKNGADLVDPGHCTPGLATSVSDRTSGDATEWTIKGRVSYQIGN